MTLSDAVRNVPGRLVSDGESRCLAFATEKEQTSFLTFLEREKFLPSLENPGISCVLTSPVLADQVPAHIQGVFVCERPKAALFEIHNQMISNEEYVGPSFPTKVGKNCNISPLAAIDAENVMIGDHVTIEPFAVVKGRVSIGDGVVIHSGAVIGCKGFSFSKDQSGANIPVVDTARIVIEKDAEIFDLASVSTGVFPWEKTVIGENSRIDTRCFIAHGTYVGRNCMIAAGGLCCGNTQIGDDVWIGAGAVVSNRVSIGSHSRVSIGAVVTKDVPAGETVTGNFAIPHQTFMRNLKLSLTESTISGQVSGGGGTFRKPLVRFSTPHDLLKEAA